MSPTIKVSEARAEFLQRMKDVSDVDAIAGTFLKWCNYVNRYLYREFTNIMPEQYIQTQTYNIVAQTINYALPATFQDIIPQGTGLYLVGTNGVPAETRLPTTSFGSTSTGFYMTATNLVMTPIPASAVTYILRFIPLLSDLVAESDTFVIPQRFSQHLMNVLETCYSVWDVDNQAEAWNNDRVIASLNELVSLIKPDSQAYGLPSFSDSYYY